MSLSVDGIWKAGVWATTVWADCVWVEPGCAATPDTPDYGAGGGRPFVRHFTPRTIEEQQKKPKKPKKAKKPKKPQEFELESINVLLGELKSLDTQAKELITNLNSRGKTIEDIVSMKEAIEVRQEEIEKKLILRKLEQDLIERLKREDEEILTLLGII